MRSFFYVCLTNFINNFSMEIKFSLDGYFFDQ